MTTSIEPRDRNRDPVAPSADRPPHRSSPSGSVSGSVSTLRIAFVGPPGSGKGTQAALLAERHGLDHISTGELLRAMASEDSEAGAGIRAVMESGELIPDAFVLDLVIANGSEGARRPARGSSSTGSPAPSRSSGSSDAG